MFYLSEGGPPYDGMPRRRTRQTGTCTGAGAGTGTGTGTGTCTVQSLSQLPWGLHHRRRPQELLFQQQQGLPPLARPRPTQWALSQGRRIGSRSQSDTGDMVLSRLDPPSSGSRGSLRGTGLRFFRDWGGFCGSDGRGPPAGHPPSLVFSTGVCAGDP